MQAVLAALFPVFLLIVAGWLLRRFLIAEDAHWVGTERILYYVMFPALLIGTLMRADLTRVPVLAVGATLLASIVVMVLLCFTLRPLLSRKLHMDGPAFTSLFQGATRWHTFVALPMAGNLFGDLGLALASVALVAMTPLLNVVNVLVLLRYAAPNRPDWRAVLLAIVQNPMIWSCVVGILLNPLSSAIPAPVHVFVDALGRSSLALGLLIVGAGLRLRQMRPNGVVLVTCALKLVLMPAIGIAFAFAFRLSGPNLLVVVCCLAVPTASNSYLLARQMGGDAPLMAQILTFQTLAAAITMPIVIGLVS
jgi:malonate transporter